MRLRMLSRRPTWWRPTPAVVDVMTLSLMTLSLMTLSAAQLDASAGGSTGPELILQGDLETTLGVPLTVPLDFSDQGHAITATAFSIDLDLDTLTFDPSDDDGDGIPDAIRFPFGMADITSVTFDATDTDGEIDVLLAELSGLPLPEGLLMEVDLLPTGDGWVASSLRFSRDPAHSFGNADGQDVPGNAVVTGSALFDDGFETGDLSVWSSFVP